MEIHPDALTLLVDRHPAELLVESGVLDGDRGLGGEGADRLLVVCAELLTVLLLGEVQIAERHSPVEDRGTEEAAHRGMVGWEAH